MTGKEPDLSIVIITLNEENHLLRCLQSLPTGSEIVVLDSGSTDSTCAIAREFGAAVHNRPFDGYASQKNAALAFATRSWVLSIDADEVVDERLRESILGAITASPSGEPPHGYRIRRRLHFMGRAMRYGKTIDFPLRLFRHGAGHFESQIHEQVVISSPAPILSGELAHYSYDSIEDYFARFNSYTTRVARNHFEKGKSRPGIDLVLRPWIEFISRYFLRLGFLDGYPGYAYALLSSFYAYVKYAKLKELYDFEKSR